MHPVFRSIARVFRKRNARIAGYAALVLLVVIVYSSRSSGKVDYLWTDVARGDLTVLLTETGTLKAASSVQIKAPNAFRMSLQVLDIVPEGTQVEAGDYVIKFDTTTLEDQIKTQSEQLELAEADLRTTAEQQKANMFDLESNLTSTNYSLEAAKLSLDQLKFESQTRQETAKLSVERARLSVEEAEKRIESQKIIDAGNYRSVLYNVEHVQETIETLKKEIEGLTIRAPAPGLVVYEEIGGFGSTTMHKLAIGDTPRPGTVLLTIPDRTHFIATIKVNELDADKIRVGQDAYVRLDAYENKQYLGKVATIAPVIEYQNTAVTQGARIVLMSGETEAIDEVPTYEVSILIESSDQELNPGMTARVQVVLDTAADALCIPVGAVFEQPDGTPVVFTKKSHPDPVTVTLGKRNDRYIAIENGLALKDQVALLPGVPDVNPLGWYVESARRQVAVADVTTHLAKMSEIGLTGEYKAPEIDLTALPAFLQGIARMFDEEGEPLTQEQLAQLVNLSPGPGMAAELQKVLNGEQLKFYERQRQQSQQNGEQRFEMRGGPGGGGAIIMMGPGGPGGGGGRGGR